MPQYRIPVLDTFSWQEPIDSFQSEPSVDPKKGNRHIVQNSTGLWIGHDDEIAWYNGIKWNFIIPPDGCKLYDRNSKKYYTYVNKQWSSDSAIPDGTNSIEWILKKENPEAVEFKTVDKTYFRIDTTTNDTVQINANLLINSYIQDSNGNQVTVSDLKLALDSSAYFDEDLETVVFDNLHIIKTV